MRCCTYLRVSSEEQNNGVALERMMFDAQRAADSFGGIIPPDLVFIDIISGRKNDRPDFTSIWGLIESKSVDAVIFYRVDRLGRDAELLLKLGKLFERTKVKAYVCERNKFLNWSDLEDWDYWTRSSVAAERESRVISARLTKAHEFNRYKKQSSWVVPFGYRRNDQRKYEPNPDEWNIATRIIEIFEEENGNGAQTVKRLQSELGLIKTRYGIFNWLKNPVLRGHTPYGRKKGVKFTVYNTHSGYDQDGNYDAEKDYRLLTEEHYQVIERLINDRSMYRGSNVGKQPYPLTGLTSCVCGATCTIMKTDRGERKYFYLRCRAGEERYRHIPKHTSKTMLMKSAEKTVIQYLTQIASTELIDPLIQSEEAPPSAEVLQKLAHIEYLESGIQRFGDPSGEQLRTIARLKAEIAEMSKSKIANLDTYKLREKLKGLSDIEVWIKASDAELRSYFLLFVEQVIIDFDGGEIAIQLNPLLGI